jgi:hypothetical protein
MKEGHLDWTQCPNSKDINMQNIQQEQAYTYVTYITTYCKERFSEAKIFLCRISKRLSLQDLKKWSRKPQRI